MVLSLFPGYEYHVYFSNHDLIPFSFSKHTEMLIIPFWVHSKIKIYNYQSEQRQILISMAKHQVELWPIIMVSIRLLNLYNLKVLF